MGNTIRPIIRPSFNLEHETTIDYIVRMSDDVAEGKIPPKGIILEAYGALDGQLETPDLDKLAREGYIVYFMNGHDQAAQMQAGGTRSTLRDIYYFAKLLQDQRLTDIKGNAPLTTAMKPSVDLPVMFKGCSYGGFLALNLATNQELMDSRFTIPQDATTPEGMLEVASTVTPGFKQLILYQDQFHRPFTAFIAEAPWFPEQEKDLPLTDPNHTSASKSRVAPGAADVGWLLAVQPREKGMEYQLHLPGRSLNAMQNIQYLTKPLLLITSTKDKNTPPSLLYRFARAALAVCKSAKPGAFIAQYYYSKGSGDEDNSHNIPAAQNLNAEYFEIKSRFMDRARAHASGKWPVDVEDKSDEELLDNAESKSARTDLLSANLRFYQQKAREEASTKQPAAITSSKKSINIKDSIFMRVIKVIYSMILEMLRSAMTILKGLYNFIKSAFTIPLCNTGKHSSEIPIISNAISKYAGPDNIIILSNREQDTTVTHAISKCAGPDNIIKSSALESTLRQRMR